MALDRGIPISEKHGINPSLMVCPLCFTETGIALMGRLKGDAEAPRHCLDQEPCKECQEMMAKGFLLIERDGDRLTGQRWVIKTEAAVRIFGEENTKVGAAHIDPEAVDKLKLPREDINNEV